MCIRDRPGQWRIVPGTDLSIDARLAGTLDIASSTGNNVTLPAATGLLSGLITADQFNQLRYLPTNDEGLTESTQYAFVRNTTEGSPGEWQTVTVPTLSADDPTAGDDSVTIRTRIGTTDHGVVTFTGDSTVNISRVDNTINFTGHSVSPPSHDPYSISSSESR